MIYKCSSHYPQEQLVENARAFGPDYETYIFRHLIWELLKTIPDEDLSKIFSFKKENLYDKTEYSVKIKIV